MRSKEFSQFLSVIHEGLRISGDMVFFRDIVLQLAIPLLFLKSHDISWDDAPEPKNEPRCARIFK